MRVRAVAGFAAGLALGFAGASGASTSYSYGNFNGTNFDFLGTNETVQQEDDNPGPTLNAQFEAPSVLGDQLYFTPSSFDADSSGGGGIATSHSTFNATITSTNPTAFIDSIMITEGGDITLTDFGGGTATTGVRATLSGTVTILAALDTSVIGTIVNFGGVGAFPTTFTYGSPGQLVKNLPPDGAFDWQGSVTIDLLTYLSNAGVTSVELQLNNILRANSEASTESLIQKKAVDGPKITVVTEPGTAALVLCGLLGLALRARRRI